MSSGEATVGACPQGLTRPKAYLHTGPETPYEELGFVRDRQIAKWRWVMRAQV